MAVHWTWKEKLGTIHCERQLPDEILKKTIGFHNYRNGFEAMLDAENAKELPEEIEYEKANMDDILIYVAKESAKNE